MYEPLLCEQETFSVDDIKFLTVCDKCLWKEAMDPEIEIMKFKDICHLKKLLPDKRTWMVHIQCAM